MFSIIQTINHIYILLSILIMLSVSGADVLYLQA